MRLFSFASAGVLGVCLLPLQDQPPQREVRHKLLVRQLGVRDRVGLLGPEPRGDALPLVRLAGGGRRAGGRSGASCRGRIIPGRYMYGDSRGESSTSRVLFTPH